MLYDTKCLCKKIRSPEGREGDEKKKKGREEECTKGKKAGKVGKKILLINAFRHNINCNVNLLRNTSKEKNNSVS